MNANESIWGWHCSHQYFSKRSLNYTKYGTTGKCNNRPKVLHLQIIFLCCQKSLRIVELILLFLLQSAWIQNNVKTGFSHDKKYGIVAFLLISTIYIGIRSALHLNNIAKLFGWLRANSYQNVRDNFERGTFVNILNVWM